MLMKKILPSCYWLTLLTVLAACNSERSLSDQIGLTRSAPDEFMVLSRPSLTVPPSFRLPEPGSEKITGKKVETASEARSVLVGSETQRPTIATEPVEVENLLLARAEANEADPNIREELKPIELEQKEEVKKRKGFFGGILAKLRRKEAPVIDANAEEKRLRDKAKAENAAANLPDDNLAE